jgi:hypothetical protein
MCSSSVDVLNKSICDQGENVCFRRVDVLNKRRCAQEEYM